jgi:chemotaxis protein CheC
VEIPLIGQDGIRELITIGIGKAAGMINRMTNAHVHISVPDVEIKKTEVEFPFYSNPSDNVSLIYMKFSGYLTGLINLITPYESSVNLVDLISGEDVDSVDMDAVRIDTLMEAGNIISSCTMSAICSVIPSYPDYHLPLYRNDRRDAIFIELLQPDYEVTIQVKIRFEIQDRIIEGEVILLLTIKSFEDLISRIMEIAGDEI